jgi:F0F1-type ATP synthase alpha subunit
MELKHADLLQTVAEKKDLSDELVNSLKAILRQFTDSFKSTVTA